MGKILSFPSRDEKVVDLSIDQVEGNIQEAFAARIAETIADNVMTMISGAGFNPGESMNLDSALVFFAIKSLILRQLGQPHPLQQYADENLSYNEEEDMVYYEKENHVEVRDSGDHDEGLGDPEPPGEDSLPTEA